MRTEGAGSYLAVLADLETRGRFGVRLGLDRTRALLRGLGDPQERLRGVLIGGTNGKGSTQAIVASVLRAAGRRVGQAPKPHLVSYRERIVVDGSPIAPQDFAQIVGEVLSVADRLDPELGPPTEFELMTAAAFAWFARAAVEVAVIEVGLGGRLDATNVWDGGVVAITNVDWDHMEHLGDTLPQIAREKAAIVKRADQAVTGATGVALDIIRARARDVAAPLVEVVSPPVIGMDRSGLLVDHEGEVLRVGLLGRHQAANAGVAIEVIRALERAGIATVSDAALRAGLAEVRWPGRLELLALHRTPAGGWAARPAGVDRPDRHAPDLLLDGAHNPAGAAALVAAVEELSPVLSPGRPTLLLGVLRDKPIQALLGPFMQAWPGATLIATSVPGTPRSRSAAELTAVWSPGGQAHAIDDWEQALDRAAVRSLSENGPLIVAGSLYLVGAVRGRLVDDPAIIDRD